MYIFLGGLLYINLPSLVLKARYLRWLCLLLFFYRVGVPEPALGGIPLHIGFVIVVEDKPSELSCSHKYDVTSWTLNSFLMPVFIAASVTALATLYIGLTSLTDELVLAKGIA